jgi:hypothetical protein
MINILPSIQTPKPPSTEPKPRGYNMHGGPSAKYEWNQCFKQHEDFGDCGQADMSLAWRCPDCGRPADSVEQSSCPRCGSCETVVWR